jgi:hypothetical protein
MTQAGKSVGRAVKGRHGAANTGVAKRSVKGRAKNPAAGKVSKTNATGGGPGGGF